MWQRGTHFQRYGSKFRILHWTGWHISLRFRLEFLARWVSEVLVKGYATRALTAPSHRAYELRIWSASLALKHLVPLQSILEAAYWRSKGTFIHFYLRDSRLLREDGFPRSIIAGRGPAPSVSLHISSIELRLS